LLLGAVSLGFALFNVIGGFLVTDRMLAMYQPQKIWSWLMSAFDVFGYAIDLLAGSSDQDPELPLFKMLDEKKVIDLKIFADGVGIEKFAEFCLKQANEIVKKDTNGRCNCYKVEVWEHENNSAVYEETPGFTTTTTSYVIEEDKLVPSTPLIAPSPSPEPPPAPSPVATKLNSPPLHNQKAYNTFKDPFAGTSWGNNAKRTK